MEYNRCWARSAEDDCREGESACLASARGWGHQREPTNHGTERAVDPAIVKETVGSQRTFPQYIGEIHCSLCAVVSWLALVASSARTSEAGRLADSRPLLTAPSSGYTARGVRHERKSRTLWQKSIGNHWKSVGNHGNLARNQKSGPSRNQEISEKSQEITRNTPFLSEHAQ